MRPYTLAGLVLIVGVAAALPFRRPRTALVSTPSTTAADGDSVASNANALAVDPLAPPPPAERLPEGLAVPDADLPALGSGYGEVAIPLATPRVALDSRLISAADSPRSPSERESQEQQSGVPLRSKSAVPTDASARRLASTDAEVPAGDALLSASAAAEAPPNARFRTGLPLLDIAAELPPPPTGDAPDRLAARPASSSSDTVPRHTASPPERSVPTAQASELPAPRPRYFIREPER